MNRTTNSLEQRVWQSLTRAASSASITIPSELIQGKCILITGAGGSIGSALAHTIAALKPAQILLLDASEQALYEIDRNLAAPRKPILASAADTSVLNEVFALYRPHIVFHAAAFKHVPLMELHPFAALQNNAVTTFSLTQTAIRHHVEQIILVSTDKAVAPVSIMGASKRIAELTALALASPTTQIKAVRLGNVYASQGSVVQLFSQQIAQHRPVTVTHPEATRYFLTVDDAAALLILALSPDIPTAILIPKLAPPIRIEDVARALIHASGSPSPIIYTGLRPGEKFHEQLLSPEESFSEQSAGSLRAIRSATISPSRAAQSIAALQQAIDDRNLHQLLGAVTHLIPTYHPSETVLAQHALAAPQEILVTRG
jgi:FlaA1/EpsC-like NDP-sugar epimerase